jgi:hypothetical protein
MESFDEMALRIAREVEEANLVIGNETMEFARRLRAELLRDDEPVAWRVAEIMGDHFSFETFYSKYEAESAAGFLGEYWGGTDNLYLRPAPKVPEGWQPIETAPRDGREFIAIWRQQGNAMQIVSYNTIHGHWQTKGEAWLGFLTNATEWMPLPAAPKGEE